MPAIAGIFIGKVLATEAQRTQRFVVFVGATLVANIS